MEPGQPKFKKYLIHESILTGRVIETNIRWSVYNDKNCRIFRFEYTLFALYIIPVYNKQKEDTNYNPAPSHPHPPPPSPPPPPKKNQHENNDMNGINKNKDIYNNNNRNIWK